MVVLIGGGIAVAALVGWAVTRSMQAPTTTPAMPEPVPITQTAAPPPPQADEAATVARAEVAQLKQQVASGAVTVIDVRDMDSYVREHIPGALHIPMTRIQGEIAYIPKDKPIVTYCT
ncbi:MAG TPA: rhodanese-like domain-containing protein [Thermoanaerobaculia bacterium]|nr:rhodanese-like domain-containing protein [Thermoanaerobaculia bacterium]